MTSPWAVTSPEELPAELVEVLCGYFTGFDAFNLSLTNVWWRNFLSDESFWRRCLGGPKTCNGELSWKNQYIQSRSMLFKAVKADNDSELLDSFAYFTYRGNKQQFGRFQLTYMGGESFSLDLCFSLLPGERFGGIIYGLQSSSRESCEWPHFSQPFVMVDSNGDLYCSVIAAQPVVARALEPSRWYHVALTYDHSAQLQDVYFNGVKVQSKTGVWRYQWHFMTFAQVGTGFSTSNSLNSPAWRGFQGVVDAFRLWRGVLSQDEARKLARGGSIGEEKLEASLTHDRADEGLRHVRLAKCTRPTESRTLQLVGH